MGYSGVRLLKNVFGAELATIGRFHKRYGDDMLRSSNTNEREIGRVTRQIVDNFDEDVLRLIDLGNVGSGRFIARSGEELRTHLSTITSANRPAGVSYQGRMYRNISSDYSDAKLIVKSQTSDVDNRFTTGLYLSETKAGNVFEVTAYGGTANRRLYEFTDVRIDNLLDLTDARTIETLGTTFEQMKKIAQTNRIQYEFTQEIATWAKANGYNGIKFYGVRSSNTDYINFVIFEQSTVNNAVRGSINPINW